MAGSRVMGSRSEKRASRHKSSPLEQSDPKSDERFRVSPGSGVVVAIIAISMILGGGGTSNPQAELILQLIIAVFALALVAAPNLQDGFGHVPRAMWVLGFLVLLVPALQLIPLPPSVWQALPGREVEVAALRVAGAEGAWMPLSMAPARTFASLVALLGAVLVMLQVSRLPLRDRNWLCAAIVAVAVLSMLIGVLQLSRTAGFDWSLYSEFSKGHLIGFQANHNAQADILQIGLLAFGVLMVSRLGDGRRHLVTWFGLALGTFAFLVSIFMTGSRAGISLAVVALAMLGTMLWPFLRSRPNILLWLGGGAATIAGLAAAAWQLPSIQRVVDRFSVLHDARADLWVDTSFAIHQVWPIGSGVGTIVPMLEAAERLDVVDPSWPVRAHNDWLEWTLEAGVPGFVVLAAIFVVVGYLLARAVAATSGRRADAAQRAQAIFASGVFLILGLHSVVDYPLRSMSLAVLAAVAVAFLTAPPEKDLGSR